MTRARHSGRSTRPFKPTDQKPHEKRAPKGPPVWKLTWAARFVAKWEGWLATAYLDTIASPAVWTIGYGHTGGVAAGMRWSKAKGLRVLTRDLRSAAAAVARSVSVRLTVRQRIALISLVFNCGPGAIEGSTLQRKLNRGNYLAAANELLEWSHAGGAVVPGLLNRRREERWLFLHNDRKDHR
jgi:lysozyme